jgi:undecaprenyl-diphosphatase
MRRPLPLVLVFLAVIAVLGVVVRGRNAVTRLDADVVREIAEDRSAGLVDVARAVTYLGNGLVAGLGLLLAGGVLLLAGFRARTAFAPVASLVAGIVLAPLAKAVVERPRPPAALHEVVERTSGFPSGHSTQSAAGWLALGLVLAYAPRRGTNRAAADGAAMGAGAATGAGTATGDGGTETGAVAGPGGGASPGSPTDRARWPFLAATAVVVLLVGVSRVVLSVHSPTDVLAGWLLGTCCAVVVAGGLIRDRRAGMDGAEEGTARPPGA